MGRWRGGALVTLVAVSAVSLGVAIDVGALSGRIERISDDPAAARRWLAEHRTPGSTARPDMAAIAEDVAPPRRADARTDDPVVASPPVTAAVALSTFLLVGSDRRAGLAGERADVLLLGLLPDDTSVRPALVSLPRDLWVEDLCHGGRTRINAALNGCAGEVTGPELLGLTVEHVTGLAVDHYVEVDLEGFTAVVGELGGVEICTENPVRDRQADLALPGGCVEPAAAQVVAWVRARHLEQLVDGRWRAVPGSNDLTRNQHQQQVLLELAQRVLEVRSPLRLRDLLGRLAEHVTLGKRLGLDELVELAWRWRGVDLAEVARPQVPVEGAVTGEGAQVLIAAGDLRAFVADVVASLGDEVAA